VKEIYKLLVENIKGFGNIHSFNIALTDFDGTAEMYVSSGYSDGSSSLLKPKKHLEDHPDVFFEKKELVTCKTLDSWAYENGISKVDMLWLDMQGAEQQMLAASNKILSTVSIIHTEVSKHESYEGASLYPSLKKFLLSNNFQVSVEAIPSWTYGGNVLFTKVK
jgi:FkbM family methyltransferase